MKTLKSLAVMTVVIALPACAASVTRPGGDVGDYARDREACLLANGWQPVGPESEIVAALLGVAGSAYAMATDRPYVDGPAKVGVDHGAQNAHVAVNAGARACLDARGYVLPW